ncbi:MAG: NTP transferase domain-containing protein [Gemmatimonadota bacterium]|nr:NTP transferase domain-containing protein [Gemmatimonadota bacterium]
MTGAVDAPVQGGGGLDALVFAAGLGRRLRPLTLETPKALVDVGGVTMLERTVRRLAAAGAERIVVNAHAHLARVADEVDRLAALMRSAPTTRPGAEPAELMLSPEPARPLETGGGLRLAAPLLHGDRPILLHNVDVLTGFDLRALVAAHRADDGRLATLAVHERRASRLLAFDPLGLCARVHADGGREDTARAPRGPVRRLAFTGVHVVSPRILGLLSGEKEVFSIVDAYLHLAAAGERIAPFDAGTAAWWEIGTPERLAAARRAHPRPASG